MRFNDRELLDICSSTPIFEGRLNYRPPSGNFGQSGFKERWFRLRCNLLFYFRINESGKVDTKPSGLFVLENSNIQLEQSSSIPFAFSITFRDEPERKHIFSGRSDSNVHEWITSIKHCTYEYLRTQRILLQKKITLKTGKDPLLMCPYNEGVIRDFQLVPELSDGPCAPPRVGSTRGGNLSSPQLSRATYPLQTTFQSHMKPLVPQQSFQKESSTPLPLNKISNKLQMSFQSHVNPLVPLRNAPAVPLSKPEVQSASSVFSSSETNLIEF